LLRPAFCRARKDDNLLYINTFSIALSILV
jgi:hypothetical protein